MRMIIICRRPLLKLLLAKDDAGEWRKGQLERVWLAHTGKIFTINATGIADVATTIGL